MGRIWKVESFPMVLVIGGTGLFFVLHKLDKKPPIHWRELLKHFNNKELDGLTGLEKIFEEETPEARILGCQVQVSRNDLAGMVWWIKKVADALRSIFKAFP